MAELNERPIIFPLSNPTSKAECTFEQALRATDGRVLFASGSPFGPVMLGGVERSPSQANNAYVFPAVGLAASLCSARAITNESFLVTAEALSHMTTDEVSATQRHSAHSAACSAPHPAACSAACSTGCSLQCGRRF
jgi:malate dehydrogenase (oxaloacetate-decarboxylating)(NADP+)